MNEEEIESIDRVEKLCHLAGIGFVRFLEDANAELKNRVKNLLTPNETWFREGKDLGRYWKFIEKVTNHEWNYEDVVYWYKFLRDPSETREDIPPSLRYQVLTRDKFTCQKCGKKAPDIELQVDHILPWACGGGTVVDNLQTLCIDCNIGKSNRCFERGD